MYFLASSVSHRAVDTSQLRGSYANAIKERFHYSSEKDMAHAFDIGERHVPLRLARCVGFDEDIFQRLVHADQSVSGHAGSPHSLFVGAQTAAS